MNSTLSKVLIFAAGAILGSAVTWKIVKTKYEKIANEEIESVKEVFGRGHRAETKPVDDTIDIPQEEEYRPTNEDLAKLKETIATNGYKDYTTKNKNVKEEDDMGEPYVISPDEFDEHDDYDVVSLTYYADKVLTDEQDYVIDDIEGTVGKDSLTHFGQYEDDSVFVRNDAQKTDYEILLDTRNYSDLY